MIVHPIQPVYDKDSRVLILGSFPSVKSREEGFFYGHPQNRFWKVTAAIFNDVIASCDIEGSSDSSIRNVKVNDISKILTTADIKAIYLNGKKAYHLYQQYLQPVINREGICLPSTSPANAAWSPERLIKAWSIIKI